MDVAAASSPGPMRLRDLNLSSSPYARRTASTSSPYARRTASKSPMPERADEDPLSSTQLWHSKNTLQSDVPDSLCCRFSPDDSVVAAGFSDGSVQVFDAQTGNPMAKLEAPTTGNAGTTIRGKSIGMPASIMRFRPGQTRLEMSRRPLLLVGTVDRDLQQWNLKAAEDDSPLVYEGGCFGNAGGDQIFAMDYHPGGRAFAVAGSDKHDDSTTYRQNTGTAAVRIFDDESKKCITTLHGHQNRIMCLKHATPVTHTVLVSGGFDGLKLWDVREKNCVRSLAHGGQGVELSGDAIDCHGVTMLTASFRTSRQLQLWDLRTFKLLREDALHDSVGSQPSSLCVASFSKDQNAAFFAAAGNAAGKHAVQIFARGKSEDEHVASVSVPSAVFGLDWAHQTPLLAVASRAKGITVARLPTNALKKLSLSK